MVVIFPYIVVVKLCVTGSKVGTSTTCMYVENRVKIDTRYRVSGTTAVPGSGTTTAVPGGSECVFILIFKYVPTFVSMAQVDKHYW